MHIISHGLLIRDQQIKAIPLRYYFQLNKENEQQINICQALNEKNLLLNKDLRVKLDAVTERLDHLLKKKTGNGKSGNEKNS